MIIKLGEAIAIEHSDIKTADIALSDPDVLERFKKFANELKIIAPRAKDFLYFSAVMMHAAEASLLDDEGNIKKLADGTEVEAYWDKKGDSWRWVCNDPNIKPYKNANCFVPGTQILMADGTSKNIEDIEVGDEVITHLGNKKRVLATMFRHVENETLLKVSSRNNQSLLVTGEHPFYSLKVTHHDDRKDTQKHLLRQKNTNKNFDFVKACDLNKYDLLTMPQVACDAPNEFTASQARLLGLFAAEGSFSKKYGKDQAVIFTFNINESDTLAKQTQELLSKSFDCSVKFYQRPDKNICTVTATGNRVTEFFRKHVGEYSAHKTLSPQLLFNVSDDIRLNFITGWLEGDGHVEKQYGQIIGITVSSNLASQIRLMLNSLGIHHSLRFKPSNGLKVINADYGPYDSSDVYRIEIPATYAEKIVKNSSYLSFTSRGKDKVKNCFYDNYHISSVTGVTDVEDYTGNVYNFEVEDDNSYIANFVAVHNCDIFPEEELLKAHKLWRGRPLCLDHKSSSADFVRGLVLDTLYDEKNKRVVALCALDKKLYPELARKVQTGYATSVSMGTAVGRAVCSDCGNVARVERDFCDHMRKKSCYGEINLDLSPMELSIVVNGADPKAKIKHIIAKKVEKATEHLEEYLQGKLSQGGLNKNELLQIQEELKNLSTRVAKLAESDEDSNDTNYGTTESAKTTMGPGYVDSANPPPNPPEQVVSYNDNKLLEDLTKKLSEIQAGLNQFKTTDNEESMGNKKNAYFQGTEEPTPGQPQYPKEDYETIRDTQDKQMVGQSPFPGVGPVDGMYPGYDSFGESEEARKRRLQRLAELNERRLVRQSALEKAKENITNSKESWFQGGGDVNEPKPQPKDKPRGEPGSYDLRYQNETDYRKIRDTEDKQMVGQKPFPGVGDVDGLHPSPESVSEKDEAKRKEMLSRAKVTAKFVKASDDKGIDDKANCRWQVFANNKLILDATVDEISRGNVDGLYDAIATRDYGLKILDTIQRQGFDKAKAMFKGAQTPAQDMGAPGVAQDAMPAMPDMPAELDKEPRLEEPEGAGDVDNNVAAIAADIRDLADQVSRRADDLAEAVEKMDNEELSDVPAVEEDAFTESMSKGASIEKLQGMRKTVNVMVRNALRDSRSQLLSHAEELQFCKEITSQKKAYAELKPEQRKHLTQLISDAIAHAKADLDESKIAMAAFNKYAYGTYQLVKSAAARDRIMKQAQEKAETMEVKVDDLNDIDDLPSIEEILNNKKQNLLDPKSKQEVEVPKTGIDAKKPEEDVPAPEPTAYAADGTMVELPKGTPAKDLINLPEGTTIANKEFDLNTKEGRAKYRAKQAQTGVQFSDMIDCAHPQGGHTPGMMDIKPEGNLAEVETIKGTHEGMMKVVETEPKAAKQAQRIAELVRIGKISHDQVDNLVSEGVDPKAVQYYKQYWAEAGDSESKEWAADLVKETTQKKAAEERAAYEVRIKRSYDLAYQMFNAGLISEAQIPKQVEDMSDWSDSAYESTKRIVQNKLAMRKQAQMPNVGILNNNGIILPGQDSLEKTASVEGDMSFKELFEDYFASKSL